MASITIFKWCLLAVKPQSGCSGSVTVIIGRSAALRDVYTGGLSAGQFDVKSARVSTTLVQQQFVTSVRYRISAHWNAHHPLLLYLFKLAQLTVWRHTPYSVPNFWLVQTANGLRCCMFRVLISCTAFEIAWLISYYLFINSLNFTPKFALCLTNRCWFWVLKLTFAPLRNFNVSCRGF